MVPEQASRLRAYPPEPRHSRAEVYRPVLPGPANREGEQLGVVQDRCLFARHTEKCEE